MSEEPLKLETGLFPCTRKRVVRVKFSGIKRVGRPFFKIWMFFRPVSPMFLFSFLGDETFANVFRDFSNMASMDPERLKRNFDPDRQSNV